MIDIDTSVPLRTKAQLLKLIDAVVGAEVEDEDEWIEWKRTLDLTDKAGWFHIARAVLGMANRLPADAAHRCGGHGYILVGVGPARPPASRPWTAPCWCPGWTSTPAAAKGHAGSVTGCVMTTNRCSWS